MSHSSIDVFENGSPQQAMALRRKRQEEDEVRKKRKAPDVQSEKVPEKPPSRFQLDVRQFLEFAFEKKNRRANRVEEIREGLRKATTLLCSEACQDFAVFELKLFVSETYRQSPQRFDLGVFLHVVGALLLDKTERLPKPKPVVDESDPWPPKEERWQELLLLQPPEDHEDWQAWQERIRAQVKDDFKTTMERRKNRWIKEWEFLEREKERFFAEQLGKQLTACPDAPLVQWFDTFFAVRHRPESMEKHQCLIFDLFAAGYFPRPRVQIKLLDILRKSGLEINVSPERVRPIGRMSVMGYKEYKELRELQAEEACKQKPGEDPEKYQERLNQIHQEEAEFTKAEEERLKNRYWRKVEQGLVATPQKPAGEEQLRKMQKKFTCDMKTFMKMAGMPDLPLVPAPEPRCPLEALITESERPLYESGTIPFIKPKKRRRIKRAKEKPEQKLPGYRQKSLRSSSKPTPNVARNQDGPLIQDGQLDDDQISQAELPHEIMNMASCWGLPKKRSKKGGLTTK